MSPLVSTPPIVDVTPELWRQAWETRKCLNCGAEKTQRQCGPWNRDAWECGACKFVVWYNFDLTEAGSAVARGYGWAGAPFRDGTYPKLRENERYGWYFKQPDPEPYTGEGCPF